VAAVSKEWHMNPNFLRRQAGLSIGGLIIVLIGLAMVAMLAMQVIPAIAEYRSIRGAIYTAKENGKSVQEIKASFTNQRISGYFTAIGADDLEITKEGNDFDVSFAYQKKIPLFGPASLLFDFEATTAKTNPFKDGKKASASIP
jgi:hypothetical protein